jgi:hypothetical protein
MPLSGCATVYHAEAIEGSVVDAETGKPLEGVIIVAHWELKGGLEGGTPIAELQIFETVTDSNGRYYFPSWGPKLIPPTGQLQGDSPGLMLFKPGYRAGGFSNLYSETYGTSTFFYNKKMLKLERFKGTPAEYAEHLSSLSSSLEKVGYSVGYESGDWCGWKSFPRMLRALDKLEAEFRAAGVRQGTVVSFLRTNEARVREKGCGSVSELLNKVEK